MSDKVMQSLATYAVGEKAGKEAFGPLREFANEVQVTGLAEPTIEDYAGRAQYFLDTLEITETEFMENNYSADAGAKSKAGKWKLRTYLPKAYSSAKSVLKKALTLGTPILTKSKGELEKECRTPAAPAAPKVKTRDDLMGEAETHLTNFTAVLAALSLSDPGDARYYADQAVSRTLVYST